MSKSPVVHFEMPAKDNARVSKFYTDAFGWQMNQMGPEMGDYLIAQTAETDANNMVQTPGTINGGFFKYQAKPGFDVPHLVLSVDNLEEAMKAVVAAGGKIIGGASGPDKIDDIPGIGRYVSFEDTEGNHVGMLEPAKRG